MKKRFSIWVREHGSDRDIELCQVDGDPKPIMTALYAKRLNVGEGKTVAQYGFIRIVDNACEA